MEQRNKLTEKTWKLGAPSGKQSAFGCQPALRIFFYFHTKKEKKTSEEKIVSENGKK